MYYVYVIQSINNPQKRYIGSTSNINKRLATHNSGGSKYTKDFRPWKLILFLGIEDKYKAIAFEKYLKSGAGCEFAKRRFWE
ncbi:GIY-YIG nuclease family protein [bacterium]|nr:GIY-YIG nuclease family protein [bacterium]